jgi:hypothetical protein
MPRDDSRACGAIRYHDSGGGRDKHWCHRAAGHRDRHHSDHGLWWSRNPYAWRVRLDQHMPCADCQPVGAKTAARR